jgi:hypothetical protein
MPRAEKERRVLPGKDKTSIEEMFDRKRVRKVKRARIHRSGLPCGDIMEFGELFGDDEEKCDRACQACFGNAGSGLEVGGLVICSGCVQDMIDAVIRSGDDEEEAAG